MPEEHADHLDQEREEFFVPSSKNDIKEGSGTFSLHPMSLDDCMDELGKDGGWKTLTILYTSSADLIKCCRSATVISFLKQFF